VDAAGGVVHPRDAVLPVWLGLLGVPIGIALLVGTLEFVGRNERDGWALAGTIVPIAYIVWSLWLVGLGIALLVA
jgi:F0F1-type ATP synthase membrane subunit c/vacuolar-type H+-ATPase subunit K